MGTKLILASSSPRRHALLLQAAVRLEVDVSDVPEVPESGEAPEAFARRVARQKASAVAARHADDFVLAADTIVVIDGLILGKPVDRAHARHMLQLLSGRAHRVLTAVVL